ncbi:hypothetical protein [Pseudonocardia acaciae]|uniref:hypothetical protein n=1 Tax=Pseudonocardia acaciae TaxID=551276 RepID=UPI00048BE86F|nr:hypothetical protein [Pseudonocardia acaciae]
MKESTADEKSTSTEKQESLESAPKKEPQTSDQELDKLLADGTTATIAGNAEGSFFARYNAGSVTMYNGVQPPTHLVARWATDDERLDARCAFVEPPGYLKAMDTLREHRVVVIFKRGSGRSFAARRLLMDCGANAVAEINPDRAPHTINENELEERTGYIWDGSQEGDQPLRDRDLDHSSGLLRQAGCWLVIVLDRQEQVPDTAAGRAVALTAPPPVDVAEAIIRRRRPADAGEAVDLVRNRLAVALSDGDPPRKAERAAGLAIRVVSNGYSPEEALNELREDVRTAVARWFADRTVIEYPVSLALAIALLEDQPYDEVVESTMALDLALRTAEMPQDRQPRPRRLFAMSKAQALDAINACVVVRDHPEHRGLREETVRFERQDWAAAVVHHVWKAYPAAQVVLRDWMCGSVTLKRFFDKTRQALCIIIAEVPAHRPLRLVDDLAKHLTWQKTNLAAAVLRHLADDHNLGDLVTDTLERWVKEGPAYGQCVAAIVYTSPFGLRDPEHALRQLRTIARSKWTSPNTPVAIGLLDMLSDADWQQTVLDRVVKWSQSSGAYHGVRLLATWVGLGAAGVYRWPGVDADELVHSFPNQVRTLLEHALADPDEGRDALERMYVLATKAEFDRSAADDLYRITTLLAPNLRWLIRLRAVRKLCAAQHGMRLKIRWTFRVARKVQRARSRGTVADTPNP